MLPIYHISYHRFIFSNMQITITYRHGETSTPAGAERRKHITRRRSSTGRRANVAELLRSEEGGKQEREASRSRRRGKQIVSEEMCTLEMGPVTVTEVMGWRRCTRAEEEGRLPWAVEVVRWAPNLHMYNSPHQDLSFHGECLSISLPPEIDRYSP